MLLTQIGLILLVGRPEIILKVIDLLQDAEAACVEQGGHLTSVRDVSENAFVWLLAGSNLSQPWIGLDNADVSSLHARLSLFSS